MPIDREKALANAPRTGESFYSKDDVILYHLGLGAGVPATDPKELEYTYEKNLKVLPSFAVVANARGAQSSMGKLEGLDYNPAMLLHGEEEVIIHKPLPPEAKLTTETRIADVFDKGKAALLIMETSAKDEDGDALYSVRMSLFLRGEGGFGGPEGPKPANVAPDRKPDGVIEREWGGGRRVQRTFELTEVPAWVYVRVVLGDGEIAWDSPWWPEEES